MAEELRIVGRAELSHADFLGAWSHIPAFKRQSARALLLPALWLPVAWGSLPARGCAWEPAKVLSLSLTFAFVLALTFFFRWYLPRAWAKRAVADTGRGELMFRLDEAGLAVTSPLRQLQLAWASLPGYLETAECFVVYTGSQAVLLLPKRAFEAPEQVGELLRTRIGVRHEPSRFGRLLLIWLGLVVLFLGIWQWLNPDTSP
jgi:YcxB-like protein